MQHFRKVTTLAEDFAAMGLAEKPANETFFPSEMSESDHRDDMFLDEALVVQRTKKMTPGEKAKARRYRTKNKSKLSRQKAIRDRKPQTQLRKTRQARLKGGRSAGPRRRFVLNQDMSQMRNQMKALQELRKFHSANSTGKKNQKQLTEALERIIRNAQILSRKYAVLEEIKSGSLRESAGIPIEYPGLSVDWENPDAPNINPAGKDMDATDYAKDSKLSGNVKAEDDMDPSDNQDWWADVDGEGDDEGEVDLTLDTDDMSSDDEGELDLDDGEVEMGDDDDEIELDIDLSDMPDDEEEETFESRKVSLSYEMAKFCTEAEDVLAKMKTSVLSPSDAAAIVKDMVVFLGGAMKAYLDIATQVAGEYEQGGYAGQGAPVDVKDAPEDNGNDNKYAGKDSPPDAGESPEIYKLSK